MRDHKFDTSTWILIKHIQIQFNGINIHQLLGKISTLQLLDKPSKE